MVSWLRVADLQILTAGPHVFTSDRRISVDFEAATAAADDAAAAVVAAAGASADADHDDDLNMLAAPLLTETSWPLTIRQVQPSDVGLYECQINTEPKIKGNVSLVVLGECWRAN